jgi:hypothetical protein
MYQPLIKFHPYPAIIMQVLAIFDVGIEDTCARCEKYSNRLDVFRSLMRIFIALKLRVDKHVIPP